MKARCSLVVGMSAAVAGAVIAVLSAAAVAQGPAPPPGPGRGQGAGRGAAPAVNLPQSPTAVALPTVSDLDHRARARLRIGAVAGARSRPGHLQGHEAREYLISGTANGQPYKTRLVVRRPSNLASFSGLRADRADASERLRPHVRVHLDLHDVLGTRGRRGRHRRSAAGRRRESTAVRGTVGRTGTGERDPGAGRCVDQGETVHRTDGRAVGPEGHSGRHVGDGGNVDSIPAGAHGLPHAGHAAHLRRFPAHVQRIGDPAGRRAAHPRADDARGEREQHHRAAGRRCAGRSVPRLRVRRHGPHRQPRQRSDYTRIRASSP